MEVAKRDGRENRTKEGLCAGVKTSGKTNSTPGWASSQSTGPGRGGKRYKREEPKLGQGPFFSSRLLVWHALRPPGCIFLYFLNKTEL